MRAAGRPSFQLALSTISFFVCFAAWGLISAFAPGLRTELGLTATQTSMLVAVPVLLGALARIPMGLLTDSYGGRVVFAVLMAVSAGAVLLVEAAHSFPQLIATGFLLGLAGSSFAVGIGFTAKWYAAEQQGTALGIYGMGNMGQSAAVFLGPVLAASFGRSGFLRGVAAVLAAWAVVFAVYARNASTPAGSRGLRPIVEVMAREKLAWVLSAFYFLTFGGFVAFSIYLPALLKDDFGLAAADAGFRTAGFVVLATVLRPVGGILSDRIGGARVLSGVFFGIIPFALLLGWTSMIPFTVGALGCAALLGLGNGAVFKLVPQYFPGNTGTVTGLVGAMGGLGGFFPPLVLGMLRDRLGAVWPGFTLLAAVAAVLWLLNQRIFIPQQKVAEAVPTAIPPGGQDRMRAGAWATTVTGFLCAAIVVGSRNLENFDAALVAYTFAVIFATWGTTYHYAVWLQKPPTRRFWERSLELVGRYGAVRSAGMLGAAAASNLLAQRFIRRRSRLRWWMHQCLFWGCLLAAAITFPLVFGWIHFASAPGDQMTYVTYLFGFPVSSFPIRTVSSWLLFHGLDIAAVLVLAGIGLSLWRRLRHNDALSLESFANDFFPLALLFAISITGLMLTASTLWLRGSMYGFLAILHAITVIAGLLYLPFGKLFHIFQRPAQLGIRLYREAGDADPGTNCMRCGERFASQMQVDDLRRVLGQLGFDYSMPGGAGHWQALCPACKRKTIANAQMRIQEAERGQIAYFD